MALEDCIKKINKNSRLPSFDQDEINQIEEFKKKYADQAPEVADRLAARDYAKFVNDGLNNLKSSIGVETNEIVDEFDIPSAPEQTTIEQRSLSSFDQFRKGVQDQSIKVKRFQEDVEQATGKEVFGTEQDAYNKLDLEKNKSNFESKRIIEEAVTNEDSFVNKSREKGVSFNQDDEVNFGKYLHAKHAKERNARIKEIGDEKITSLSQKIDRMYSEMDRLSKSDDKAKIKSLQNRINKAEDDLLQLGVSYEVFGSGMTDEEADGFLESMTPEQTQAYEDSRKEFNDNFISRLLGDRESTGMISKEQKDRLSIFENYVPLKIAEYENINESDSEITKTRRQKKKTGATRNLFGIKGADNDKARVDPFVATLNELTSLQGNIAKNNVIKSFANLVEESGAKVEGIQVKSGIPKTSKDKFGLDKVDLEYPPGFNEDNSIRFFDDGKAKFIKIDDKDLFDGLTQGNQILPQVYNNKIMRGFAWWFRNVNTTWNPEFMISNFFRDFQAAAVLANLEIEDMNMAKFTKETGRALKAMTSRNFGKPQDSEMQQVIDEYEASGAKIGWSSLTDVSKLGETMAEISSEIKPDGVTKMKNAGKKIVNVLENAADVAEHSSRIAAFKIAKDSLQKKGDPNALMKAAIAAKEVTINFNRRGQAGNALNLAYIFLNAGIQGTTRTFTALSKSPKIRMMATGLFGLGVMEGLLNDLFGDDEDEYEQLDEFRKERYYNFKIPGQGMVQIPLPYGLSFFKYMGAKTYEMSKKATEKRLDPSSTITAFSQMMGSLFTNFSPISGSTINQILAPTIADPIIQAYENKNFAGTPIVKESFSNVDEVRSQKGKDKTPSEFKALAEGVNYVTFGDANTKGLIDWEPELYKHYLDSYTGGAGRFVGRSLSGLIHGGMAIANGEGVERDDINVNEFPIVRQFFRELPQTGDIKRIYEMYEKSKVKLYSEDEVEMFYEAIDEAAKNEVMDVDRALQTIKSFEKNQIIKAIAEEMDISFEEASKLY